jgi:hypothetical protein
MNYIWKGIKDTGMFILVLFIFLPILLLTSPISTIKALHRIIVTREIETDIPLCSSYKYVVLSILEEHNLRQDLYTEDLAPWPAREGDSTDKITLHFKGTQAATAYTLAIGNTLRDRIEKRGTTVGKEYW